MTIRHMHQVEQALVLTLGFVLGAALAVCIAPGDVLLWLAAGVVLSIFSRAFFIGDLGGEFVWPFEVSRKTGEKSPDDLGPRPTGDRGAVELTRSV